MAAAVFVVVVVVARFGWSPAKYHQKLSHHSHHQDKISLVIIPIALIINNSLAYLVASNLNKTFNHHLCPLMFDDDKHTGDG